MDLKGLLKARSVTEWKERVPLQTSRWGCVLQSDPPGELGWCITNTVVLKSKIRLKGKNLKSYVYAEVTT